MPHVNWSATALADLDRIYVFYARKHRTAGLRAVVALERGVEILGQFPSLGKPAEKAPFRELAVAFGRREFFVLYDYDLSNARVTIAAIRHGREEGYSPSETEDPAN